MDILRARKLYEGGRYVQWREITKLLKVFVALFIDDHRRTVVSTVHDTMTDLHDLGRLDPCMRLEMLQEEGERAFVIRDSVRWDLLGVGMRRERRRGLRGRCFGYGEGELGGRGGEGGGVGFEDELYGVECVFGGERAEEGDLERGRACVHGEDEASVGHDAVEARSVCVREQKTRTGGRTFEADRDGRIDVGDKVAVIEVGVRLDRSRPGEI